MTWYYLSFADEVSFLGSATVEADSFTEAVLATKALGINPGGEAAGMPYPSEDLLPPPEFRNRLLGVPDMVTAGMMPTDSDGNLVVIQ